MRCFLAIELPDEAKVTLEHAGAAIRNTEPSWADEKWVAPGALHVTLKFLGELEPELAQRFAVEFSARARAVQPFSLELTGLTAVPRSGRASMVWAGVGDPSARCAQLAAAAEELSRVCGIRQSEKAFRPHVTLVRARRPRCVSVATLDDAVIESAIDQSVPMSVLSASLFSSRLTPSGALHELLWELKLGDHYGPSNAKPAE
jgi:2'-5' RNA ligase